MDVKGLEELIREVVVKYMDVEKHGGKVLVIRNNEVREFTDIVSARRAALSMTGIVLLIQVPSRDEVDDSFLRFLRVHRSS
jgi:phosphosulfolactate synthase (CoM biosynthesis protein A)